ncbi:MAG: hypothetical protein HON98_04265 [Chloroflexi bacterium]|jgi:hypothetical protein|nr:hypothetical protein [Chloroflexota bacterium]MBT3671248.1 hypothetical protein [Chloroflexota bacterium]MBT4004360.1 hypothetical protein [Chloroflexota bacterium]MBT4304293.1 hypothetical protein [Chloroflexota bacterium]MBT4534312.1 hypothetical protein [Chloroflexota bacterium]
MYSWDEDTTSWYGKSSYAYDPKSAKKRKAAATRAKASGPRTYDKKGGPNEKIIDPKKRIKSKSKNPLIIAVDVTGSMSTWPGEIFDRLPLLFNTLSQYREDLEICFVAIGDAKVDRWPLQVTTFASGFDLEQQLGSLYGEGGGGDAPESYGLFAHWVNTHVEIADTDEKPFLIVFGDIDMHEEEPHQFVTQILGDKSSKSVESIKAWNKVSDNWNTWFLRRPNGKIGDKVDKMWGKAIGEQKIFHIQDEQRAVDYAMGLIARAWGHFSDFQSNMLARQNQKKVDMVIKPIEMICPRCGGSIPVTAEGMFSCTYCGTTLKIS